MNYQHLVQRSLAYFLFVFSTCLCALTPSTFNNGDIVLSWYGRYRPESFLGKNTTLLNSCNKFDQLFWARHTFDMGMHMTYGHVAYDKEVLTFDMSLRNKSRWGDITSIASTTQTRTRALDEIGREHKHAFPRLISWMREIWLEFDIAQAVGLTFTTNPKFKMGAFPFSLGRGIALGAAYAVGPEFLGFYSDAAVDQFAFGAQISDTFIQDVLDFDFYVGLLQNKAGSLSQTGAIIRAQEFGHRECPERGPYKINFAAASRFKWTVFNTESSGKCVLEPYAVFNHDPEQRVEFTADAESKLFTVGFAGEYTGRSFELGFDCAANLGRQRVKGWDRNHNMIENRNGVPVIVNTHVVANIDPLSPAQIGSNDVTQFKAINAKNTVEEKFGCQVVSTLGKAVQNLVDTAMQCEQFNGMKLGVVDNYSDTMQAPVPTKSNNSMLDDSNKDSIFNAKNRFRDEYKNKYEGWMIVGDMAWWPIEKELRIAVAGGFASGDANPNEENKDNVYSGFIPLQEFYFGKRVPSIFLLGSGSRLSRPLSQPRNSLQAPSKFASSVNGFTNLILGGGGIKWQSLNSDRRPSVNTNVIAFWQPFEGFKFDAATCKDTNELASNFLGVEWNVFFDYMMFENSTFFIVGSIFVPGKHFSDIKGRPINADQERRLNRFNKTSITGAPIPNIGDDIAFTLNVGMEVKF